MPVTRNYKNDNSDVISNEIATIPRYDVKTGTVVSENLNVTGSGTKFKSECKAGDWICDPSNFEVRKIKNVTSDTFLTIDKPFTVPLASATFKRIKFTDFVNEVFASIKSGDADGIVDGNVMKNGVPYLWSLKSAIEISGNKLVDPLTFSAIGTNIYVTTTR